MKKIILIISLIGVLFLPVAAQDNMLSKRGTPILPEKGDFSVGFDAVPFLEYFGNMFSSSGTNTISAQFPASDPFIITGTYHIEPYQALRGRLGLGFGNTKTDTIVDLVGPSVADLTTTNSVKVSESNITIGAGKQWSRGKHRVRANYGVDGFIGFGSDKITYDYGQQLSDTNNIGGATRPVENKQGTTFGLGIRGFLSVEYFFAPKISLSAQYGWGISFESTGKGTAKEEYWDSFEQQTKTNTEETGKTSAFYFGSNGKGFDNTGGSINLTFYF